MNRKTSSHIFIEYKNQTLSYQDFSNIVFFTVIFLKSKGVKKNDCIASYGKTLPFHIALIFACRKLRVKILLLNFRNPPQSIKESLPIPPPVLVIGEEKENIEIQWVSFDEIEEKYLKQKNKKQTNLRLPFSSLKNDKKSFTLMQTSGTQGRSKWIALSWYNHFINAKNSNKILCFEQMDKWLLSLPLYHVSGLSIIFRTYLAKATLKIVDKEDWIESLEDPLISHASFVPSQIRDLEKRIAFQN